MGEYKGYFKHKILYSHIYFCFNCLRFYDADSGNLPAGILEENGDVAALCRRWSFSPSPFAAVLLYSF